MVSCCVMKKLEKSGEQSTGKKDLTTLTGKTTSEFKKNLCAVKVTKSYK